MSSDLSRIELEEEEASLRVVLRAEPSLERGVVGAAHLGVILALFFSAVKVVADERGTPFVRGVLLAVFLFVFVVVGRRFVFSLWALFGHEEIRVDAQRLTVTTRLWGLARSRSFPTEQVRSVRWNERRMWSNSRHMARRTLLFDINGEPIQTARHLSFAEANRLERELRRFVDRVQVRGADEAGTAPSGQPFRSPGGSRDAGEREKR